MGLHQCRGCGKLIEAEQGRRLCRECSREFRNIPEAPSLTEKIESHRREQEERYQELFRADLRQYFPNSEPEPFFPELPQEERTCTRCHERLALPDSEFCLHCQVTLFHNVSGAAREVAEEIAPRPRPRVGLADIEKSLEEKRARTASSRLNIAPPSIKKY